MRKAAMVLEVRNRSADDADNIDVRGLGGQRQRQSGESGPAIEAGAAEATD